MLRFALCLLAFPAAAQQCADHAAIVQGLATNFGELRQALGLTADSAVVEVFANPETGTWTFTLTQPGGPTCMVASGEAWQPFAAPTPGVMN